MTAACSVALLYAMCAPLFRECAHLANDDVRPLAVGVASSRPSQAKPVASGVGPGASVKPLAPVGEVSARQNSAGVIAEPRPRVEPRPPSARRPKRLSDAEIRKRIVKQSIAEYADSCPCPFSRAKNRSKCGRRSAHTRKGGAAPLCYAHEVTAAAIAEYRLASEGDSSNSPR